MLISHEYLRLRDTIMCEIKLTPTFFFSFHCYIILHLPNYTSRTYLILIKSTDFGDVLYHSHRADG